MTAAAAGIREQMADANRRYEATFGQVYLVCASGLSAPELLAICLARLGNDPQTERAVVLGELAGIARARLASCSARNQPGPIACSHPRAAKHSGRQKGGQ